MCSLFGKGWFFFFAGEHGVFAGLAIDVERKSGDTWQASEWKSGEHTRGPVCQTPSLSRNLQIEKRRVSLLYRKDPYFPTTLIFLVADTFPFAS